jgi:manganese transport protein
MIEVKDLSLSEVHSSIDTTGKSNRWKKALSFLGPAYLISVGYMDPGNWATDLQGGSRFGYTLMWVLLMSNLMALLLQGLSSRLGIVRGIDLAQANRRAYPRYINLALYVFAEIAIAACDLAEVLGMAIGIQLLTGLPLVWGVSITVLDTFLLLYLQKLGMRKMEIFIIGLIAIVAISFLIEIIFAQPHLNEVVHGLIPSLPNEEARYIAIGIIGATVMPHNLYLHSALVQTRKIERSEKGIREALHYNRIDNTIALNIAFLVNAGILVLAATVFFKSGNSHIEEIKEAYRLLPGFLGNAAPKIFAIALIAAGQSSTITGTLAGQIVMEGYLRLRINPWVRRLLTRLLAIIPALLVVIIKGENQADSLLVLSQVILSLQLGFAVIPLIHFVSDKKSMGIFTITPLTKIISWLVAAILIYLNISMLVNGSIPFFEQNAPLLPKIGLVLLSIFFLALLLYIILHPFVITKKKAVSIQMHPAVNLKETLVIPEFKKIAVALDFSENDEKLLAFAIGQGKKDTEYILVHVVESASAKLLGNESDDYETRHDKERMSIYVNQLKERGLNSEGFLGFGNRAQEISSIVKNNNADMLVAGAHGHMGLKDFIYGETVNTVRHELKIPVLIVNL